MILAAGLGARLRPLTDSTPKILAPVLGLPLLERLVAWLVRGGAGALAMNTHHLADQAAAHAAALAERHPHWPAIRLYHEPVLLGTGGGVANVADFWGEDPLLVWNGDVVAELEPATLWDAHRAEHRAGEALATLAVQERPGTSLLQVDEAGFVCGIDSMRRADSRLLRTPQGELRRVAFNGVSVLSAALRHRIARPGPFDLIDALLEVIADGAPVHAYDSEQSFWGTTGSAERLAELEEGLRARPGLLARWTPEEAG